MSDILADLEDLHKQATTERSHYYVASCCRRAMEEIANLRATVSVLATMVKDAPPMSGIPPKRL